MRRKDREVTGIAEVFDMLNRCETIRIGMQGEKYPYVIPVSFGAEMAGGKAVVYFHCAREGMKTELLEKNPYVCVEGDIFIRAEKTVTGITARYESVIGFGKCEFLSGEGLAHGLKALTEHYGFYEYPLDECRGLQNLLVGKIVLDEITGKRNLPETSSL